MKRGIKSIRLPSATDADRIEQECRNDPDLQRQTQEITAAAAATCRVFSGLVAELKELREQSRVSLRDLAEKTGATPGSLSLLERGRGNPTVDTLRRYAAALGCEIEVVAKVSVKS